MRKKDISPGAITAAARKFYETDSYIKKAEESFDIKGFERVLPYLTQAGDGFVVELGCGKGKFAPYLDQWLGLDLSYKALPDSKPGICCSIEAIPLKANSAAAIFSFRTIEHIPDPEKVLLECARVIKPGGMIVHHDAWFCRPIDALILAQKPRQERTAADGLKLIFYKLILSDVYRFPVTFVKRLLREIVYLFKGFKKGRFLYKRLNPVLDQFITSDSDAFASMDPHEVALFYKNHGFSIVRPATFLKRLFHRGFVVVCKTN